MNVGIVAQRDNPRAASLAGEVRARLEAEGVDVVVDEATASYLSETDRTATGVPVEEMADCELVVSIGGDGTFLFAARGAGTTPVMGVNLGEVGFLNAVAPENAVEETLAEVDHLREHGRGRTQSVSRVEAVGDGWTIPPAINEVSVLGPQRGHGYGIGVEVAVDGNRYAGGRADGVIVATPTGTTAYNLSEGGPLVHPHVDGLVVTGMAATDGMPPLVIGSDSEVEVKLTGAPEAVVASDGRIGETVTPPATIRIRRADEPVNIAGPPLDFFAGLGKLD